MLANSQREGQGVGAGGAFIVSQPKRRLSGAHSILWFNFEPAHGIPLADAFVKKVKFELVMESPKTYFSARGPEWIEEADVVIIDAFENFTVEEFDRLPYLRTLITQSSRIDHIKLSHSTLKTLNVERIGGHYCAATIAEKCLQNVDYFVSHLNILEPKKIGIIGMGVLGSAIAQKFFDKTVLYHDPFVLETNTGVSIGPNEVFRYSDVIILACPVNHRTQNLISKETEFTRKPLIFNLSGGRVATLATLDYLKSAGQIAGYWFDFADFVEFRLDAIKTPHTAWRSNASMEDRYRDTIKILQKLFGKIEGDKKWQIAKLAE